MKLSLTYKLLLALALTVISITLMMLALVRIGIVRGFDDYVLGAELQQADRIVTLLARRYQRHGSWDRLEGITDLRRLAGPGRRPPPGEGPEPWQGDLGRPPPPDRFGGPDEPRGPSGQRPRRPPPDPLGLLGRATLLDTDGRYLAGNPKARRSVRRPIHANSSDDNSAVIGYLSLAPLPHVKDSLGRDFLDRQNRNLAFIGLAAMVLSALIAGILARHMRQPINQLSRASHRLATGDYATRLPETRSDELGQIAIDFNRMARSLERQEQARRQWVADTSHELRTPIAVLKARLEALRDGVMPTSESSWSVLLSASDELGLLVEDLYQLAQTDTGVTDYQFGPVDIGQLLLEAAEASRQQCQKKQLRLSLEATACRGQTLTGDRQRLGQLLRNLLTNSIRYTDPGGRIHLACRLTNNRVHLILEDSAPGIPTEALPHLFERFYRVEASRSREHGGSGLGLSICHAIVTAHGGQIHASASGLGGLCMDIELPLAGPA